MFELPAPRRVIVRARVMLAAIVVTLLAAVAAGPISPAHAEDAPAGMSPVAQRPADMVTADSLPTAQIGDGVVWSQAIAGDTVYAGGDFTTARPPGAAAGSNEVSRPYLLAYSLSTGELTSFNPELNNKVYATAVSPDGKRLYIGGAFTSINGTPRYRLAAFDVATGTLISSFQAGVDYNVKALVATNDTVYAGGLFTKVGSQDRPYLAAFSAKDGALVDWAPVANRGVTSLALTPDKSMVIAGGSFSTVNDKTATGLAAIDATTGVVKDWEASTKVKNYGSGAAVTSVKTDGTFMYATGYTYATGYNLEGTVSIEPSSGKLNWVEDCHGDTYDNYPASSGVVYTVSHAHYCGNVGGFWESDPWTTNQRPALAFTRKVTGTVANNTQTPSRYYDWGGNPSPSLINWFPRLAPGDFTGQSQAAWTITGNDQYVVMGGEFPTVNNKGQQGLARFAVKPLAPAKRPPEYSGAGWKPTARSIGGGSVRVGFRANTDTDDLRLTYKILRDGNTANPIKTFTEEATYWERPNLGFTDTGLEPGSTHTYRIYATDSDGNTASSDTVSVTVRADAAAASAYAKEVLDDGAGVYLRLGDSSGSAVQDLAGGPDGTSSGVTRGVAGAINGDSDTAMTFDGSSGTASSGTQDGAPAQFTAEAWVKTTTRRGGKILGYGSSASGNSSRDDRHIYMDNNGRLIFGISNTAARTITTPGSYNDGKWHHVVATFGSDGMRLYVDGQQRAADSSVTSAAAYTGYWRVGGDSLTGWPSKPTSNYLAGTIDEVATYPRVLSAATIANHRDLGVTGSRADNVAPTAAFTSTATGLTAAFDASGSADSDGTVASYAWDFGDGSAAGTGKTPSHDYAKAGTYTVTLTVTDNGGATAKTTRSVTVTAPNGPPQAAFTVTADNLTAQLDASGSSDADGTIESYAWDFGDGSAAASGRTTSHQYAEAGTYPVTLTVTDDEGATGTVTQDVTVSGPVKAKDAFGRTSASGLGSAEVGGAYTVFGSAANYSVSGGAGALRLTAAGATNRALLGSTSVADTDLTADFAVDKAPTGGNTYTSVLARRQGSSDYRASLLWRPDQQISLYVNKVVGGTSTTLRNIVVPDLTTAVGKPVTVRLQVTGSAPARIQAKVWETGTTEPSAWQIQVTDSSPELAGAGSVGVENYLSGAATNAPVTVSLDNLVGRDSSAG